MGYTSRRAGRRPGGVLGLSGAVAPAPREGKLARKLSAGSNHHRLRDLLAAWWSAEGVGG